jgi:hypothetical protein
MKQLSSFFILVLLSSLVLAQTNETKTIKYTPEYKFKDGLYLNFEAFRNNLPIDKTKIIAPNLDRKDYNFVASVVEGKKIHIYDEMGIEQELKTSDLWGFCSNGSVYIYINQDFNRLPYIGNISHFVADKVVYIQNYNSPYSYYNTNPYYNPTTTSVELRQYLLDMEKGTIADYTLEAVEVALMRDAELHDEFMQLSRKKKKQKMFFYIRKFNERNPLYFPMN